MPESSLFDVERFRAEPHRLALTRSATGPTLVLGSTQPAGLVDRDHIRQKGIEVVRRRGGGGAVFLQPGDHLWVDAWIPRNDPLWSADVSAAAAWAGQWWETALATLGLTGLEIHAGRSIPGARGELVCFAGRGPGEVFHRTRKLMGLSQWRSREGALFSMCAYQRWDPGPLVASLALPAEERTRLVGELVDAAVGVADMGSGGATLDQLSERLLASFATLSS